MGQGVLHRTGQATAGVQVAFIRQSAGICSLMKKEELPCLKLFAVYPE
jgi:hypothetical protein